MRVKCLSQEHNTMTRSGLEPDPLDPESNGKWFSNSLCVLFWGGEGGGGRVK